MFTQNKPKTITYVAQGFKTGLTDLTLAIRQPDATLVSPAVTFTEQGAGVYNATFTPSQIGHYQFAITSVSNGDNFIKAEDCVAFDSTDVKNDVDSSTTAIETAVGTVGTAVAGVKTDLDAFETAVETQITGVDTDVKAVGTQVTGVQSTLTSIQTTVNSIAATEAKQGGYIA
jgi:hypothetical protein